jgi:hypothetical protein
MTLIYSGSIVNIVVVTLIHRRRTTRAKSSYAFDKSDIAHFSTTPTSCPLSSAKQGQRHRRSPLYLERGDVDAALLDERFRKFWMAAVTDGFKDDTEVRPSCKVSQ